MTDGHGGMVKGQDWPPAGGADRHWHGHGACEPESEPCHFRVEGSAAADAGRQCRGMPLGRDGPLPWQG